MTLNKTLLFDGIENIIATLQPTALSEERIVVLQPLIEFIQKKITKQEPVNLNFICTHNSRRSHLSQVWAQTFASFFNIENVNTYSGGTEATAMFSMAVKTLRDSGFDIQTLSEGNNPVYSIKYAKNLPSIIGFSKKYDNTFNPTSEFAAILTCSHADENCPFIPGAEKRIPVTFEDPKAYDNTDIQKQKYHERSIQIATEMMYVFSKVKH